VLVLLDQVFLELVEVSHEKLGAALLAGLKDCILEKSFVTLAALAVLLVLEGFHIVFDTGLDDESQIVPEDVGKQASDDSHVEEEVEQVAAGEEERVGLSIDVLLKTDSPEFELDPATCRIIGLVLMERLLVELDWKEGSERVLYHCIELLDVCEDVVILAITEEHAVELFGYLIDLLEESIESQFCLLVLGALEV
jgi:hypothetical protein